MENQPIVQRPKVREEVVRQLEQFSVEVLQAVLIFLQTQTQPGLPTEDEARIPDAKFRE